MCGLLFNAQRVSKEWKSVMVNFRQGFRTYRGVLDSRVSRAPKPVALLNIIPENGVQK